MSRGACAAFAAMALLGGVAYFFIKIAVVEVSPAAIAFSRLAIGAVVLLPVAWRLGYLRPALLRWPWILFPGVFYMAVPFTLIPIAEVYVPSSLTVIIISSVPLLVAVFGLRWDRPRPITLLGLLVGFAGVNDAGVSLVLLDKGGESVAVRCSETINSLHARARTRARLS